MKYMTIIFALLFTGFRLSCQETDSINCQPKRIRLRLNPILLNKCTEDSVLFVKFRVFSDSINNDTIVVKKTELLSINNSSGEIMTDSICNEEFRKQFKEKLLLCNKSAICNQSFYIVLCVTYNEKKYLNFQRKLIK